MIYTARVSQLRLQLQASATRLDNSRHLFCLGVWLSVGFTFARELLQDQGINSL